MKQFVKFRLDIRARLLQEQKEAKKLFNFVNNSCLVSSLLRFREQAMYFQQILVDKPEELPIHII